MNSSHLKESSRSVFASFLQDLYEKYIVSSEIRFYLQGLEGGQGQQYQHIQLWKYLKQTLTNNSGRFPVSYTTLTKNSRRLLMTRTVLLLLLLLLHSLRLFDFHYYSKWSNFFKIFTHHIHTDTHTLINLSNHKIVYGFFCYC